MGHSSVSLLLAKQKAFFASNQTRPIEFRLQMLDQLETMLLNNEKIIVDALYKDLRKSTHESWMTELGMCLEEIRLAQKKLAQWMKPKKIGTPFVMWPAQSKIYYEPLGVALIIGPWNYPVQLTIAPLIGAIAAGNCAVIKPSELTPETSKVLSGIISASFGKEYIAVVEGGIPETSALLELKFDHIFFTGSTSVGKIVMLAAAKNLVPVTLELGGKSPVIVDQTADLDLSARRIIWGKLINAGQTCVSPDYLLVHESVCQKLLEKMREQIHVQYGADPEKSESLGRIVNQRSFDRLSKLIEKSEVFCGGRSDSSELYIEPTILKNISWGDAIMQEEIFGPILPVMTYTDPSQIIREINTHPKPLAAYLFSTSKNNQKQFLHDLTFGGGCINDVLTHLGNPALPFGGVGDSGLGSYHGQQSFLTFSHSKSVLKRYKYLDFGARYAPFTKKKTDFIKWLFR